VARKTIPVGWLREKVNTFLALSDDPMVEQRKGAAFVLETVLFETNNYKGFKYLSSEWDASKEDLRDGYDDSRRSYY
jgi:hypothetical protein